MSAAENKAVFLSYASQDAEAAKRICDALRAVGVEVWFDQNELVGGDSWDAKIRGQIASCALFVPVISAATQARLEGYFRIEWKLAAQRTHAMAEEKAFLLPIVIDATRDADAKVPPEFKTVQWTKLPGGETPPKFCERVRMVLGGSPIDVGQVADQAPGQRPHSQPARPVSRSRLIPATIGAALLIAVVAYLALRPRHNPEDIAKLIGPAQAAAPQTEAQKLTAHVWALFDKMDDTSNEEWALAEELGAQATKLEPLNADAWAAYANVVVMPYVFGFDDPPTRFDRALKAAERAMSLAPDSIAARMALTNCYRLNSNTRPEAVRLARDLVKAQPDNGRVLRLAGNTLRRIPDGLDEAIGYFDRAAARPGGDAMALFGKERGLMEAGRFAEAEVTHDQASALDPGPPAAVRKLFYLLYVHDDLDRAVETVAQIPGSFLLRSEGANYASHLWLWRREPEKALAALRSYNGDYLQGNLRGFLIGQAYQIAGRLPAAQLEWRAALQKLEISLAAAPGDASTLYWKALLLGSLGEKNAAQQAAQLYEQLAVGHDTATLGNKAALRIVLGRPEEAMDLLDQVLVSVTPRTGFRAWADLDLVYARADLRHDPFFDPLRGLPRFHALLAKMGAKETTSGGASTMAKMDDKPAPPDKSVAVLAFADLSAAHDSEYFSDGISEELLNVLAKVPGLKVTARTSSFHFKGKDTPIPEIAQQLGVAYVVEGSVRKSGDKVRITAQLIKAADGFHVWSDNFDRELKDIFVVQDEIAGLIAKNLSLKLSASSAAATAPINPQAFELYVQARAAWNLRNDEGFARAEQLLNRALVLAPDFARAHAALGDVWLFEALVHGVGGTFGRPDPPEFTRGLAKIRQALALDPDLAEAHASLGMILLNTLKFAEAERELRRAIALNPNYATAHQWLSRRLYYDGRMDEGFAEIKLATELDPLSSRIADNYAFALLDAGRYTAALATVERAITLQPSNFQAIAQRASILAYMGRTAEAVACVRTLPAAWEFTPSCQVFVYAKTGLRAEAEALRPTLTGKTFWDPSHTLLVLGRKEEAIAALDVGTVDTPATFFTADFDVLDGDPRFQKFIAAIGATEARARMKAWRAAHPPETGGQKAEDGGRKK